LDPNHQKFVTGYLYKNVTRLQQAQNYKSERAVICTMVAIDSSQSGASQVTSRLKGVEEYLYVLKAHLRELPPDAQKDILCETLGKVPVQGLQEVVLSFITTLCWHDLQQLVQDVIADMGSDEQVVCVCTLVETLGSDLTPTLPDGPSVDERPDAEGGDPEGYSAVGGASISQHDVLELIDSTLKSQVQERNLDTSSLDERATFSPASLDEPRPNAIAFVCRLLRR
jgi:hypothetical protein